MTWSSRGISCLEHCIREKMVLVECDSCEYNGVEERLKVKAIPGFIIDHI